MKWMVAAVGLGMAAFGLYWGFTGFLIVQVERGWSAVIGGSVLFAAGMLMLGLAALMGSVDRLARVVRLPESKPRPAPPALVAAAVEAPVAAPQAEAPALVESAPQATADDKSQLQLDLEAQAEAEKNSIEPTAPPAAVEAVAPARPVMPPPPPTPAPPPVPPDAGREGPSRSARPVAPPPIPPGRMRRGAVPAPPPAPPPPPRARATAANGEPAHAVPPAQADAPQPEAAQGDKSFGWLERALRGDAEAASKPVSGRLDLKPKEAETQAETPPHARSPDASEAPQDLTPPQMQAAEEGKPALAASVETGSEVGVKPETTEAPKDESPTEPPPQKAEDSAPTPALAKAIPEPPPVAPLPKIARKYESQGVRYTLYEDGSIDAEAPNGRYRFASLDELRAFLEKKS